MVLYQKDFNVRIIGNRTETTKAKTICIFLQKAIKSFEVLARLSSILESTDLTHDVTVCFLFCFAHAYLTKHAR